jgi:hypothetical protein
MELGQTHVCLEKIPQGMSAPTPWRKVKLSEKYLKRLKP